MSALKPLSVGEIIDRSASFWRAHWLPLFQLFLGFQLVQYVLLKAVEVMLTERLPAVTNFNKLLELSKQDPSVWMPPLVPVFVAFALVSLVNLLLSQMSGVALTGFVFPRITGASAPTVASALQLTLKKFVPGLGLFALTLVWTGLAGLLFVLPGALAFGGGLWISSRGSSAGGALLTLLGLFLVFAGLLLLLLWFLIRFILASQVLAIEPVGALGAFRRTGTLSSGRVGSGLGGLVKSRLTLLLSIIFVILLVIGFLTGIPELIVKALYGGLDPASQSTAPQALVVPAQLLQVIIGAVVTPLYVVFQVVFYVDMRVRREGLDLELASRSAPA
jgi:hypothetical protein